MKKVISVLLAVAMLFAFAACGKSEETTTTTTTQTPKNLSKDKLIEIVKNNGKDDVIDDSDFEGYEKEDVGTVYDTYSYTIGKNANVLITKDKKTGEFLQAYLFVGGKMVNLNDSKQEDIEKFLKDNPIVEE